MCIRDSGAGAGCAHRAAGRFAGGAPGFGCDCLETGRANPCLLYTSDAADERSSVDLGGRRIIKKKKNGNDRGGNGARTKTQNRRSSA